MLANLIYVCLLTAVSPVVLYRMIRFGRYRRGIREKLFGLSPGRAAVVRNAGRISGAGKISNMQGTGTDVIWIHAVSVGEVNLLPRLVQQIKHRAGQQGRRNLSVAISTSTDTGYDLAVKKFGGDSVFFCPLDFTWAVRRTLRNLRPQQLVLTELELWPNLVSVATAQGCKVRVINGRLSQSSAHRYQKFRRFIGPTFAKFDWVGCQDPSIMRRFESCGVVSDRLAVTGSIKFDNAPTTRNTADVLELAHWAGVDPWHRVWVVGSTQDGEEAMALAVYQRLRQRHPELRLVLVPRHAQRFAAVADLIRSQGFAVHRRSSDTSLDQTGWDSGRVILVDTIGQLRDWWGVGPIATVGGSFGNRGGQNMLEPAGYGNAISFGPNTKNFQVIANQLVQAGGAVRVADQAALQQFVAGCLEDIPAADQLGKAARQVVDQHRGATEATLDAILMDELSADAFTAKVA